jgi:putative transposase
MARMPRVVVPSFPRHVTQRGNRRQKTFFGTEVYLYYIDLLCEFSKFERPGSGLTINMCKM